LSFDTLRSRFGERFRRAFGEFLAVPSLIILGFLLLAVLVDAADNRAGDPATWSGPRRFLGQYVLDTQSAIGMLTAIAGSLITVSSITFSILLLAVQQGASALTSQVVDHYLRRLSNRVYFGFFIGTSVFVLVTLVQTSHTPHPVLGVTVSTLCAATSLFALLLLIYSTIDQTRPVTLLKAIHDTTVAARARQALWLARTAPPTEADRAIGAPVRSDRSGYLARVHLKPLEALAAAVPGGRVAVAATVGDHVSTGDVIARVAGLPVDAGVEARVRRALPIEEKRDIGIDAAWGVDHIGNIGWTAISSVKSDPAVAALSCHMLQDLLDRWAGGLATPPRPREAAVAYPDRIMDQLFDAIESLIVSTAESHQHQSLALIVAGLTRGFPALNEHERRAVARIAGTVAVALPSHLPTRTLAASLDGLAAALERDGRAEAAAGLRDGARALATNHL
jgi:uncharacterized membrane protein